MYYCGRCIGLKGFKPIEQRRLSISSWRSFQLTSFRAPCMTLRLGLWPAQHKYLGKVQRVSICKVKSGYSAVKQLAKKIIV